MVNFEEKLGMVFLQMHDNFKPKDFERIEKFVNEWPTEIPLAIELRNAKWFDDVAVFGKTCELFESRKITNIIVDAAGRRDMLHMRLTTPTVFIRYVGANAESNYKRLDDWLEKLTSWIEQGLENLFFLYTKTWKKLYPYFQHILLRK